MSEESSGRENAGAQGPARDSEGNRADAAEQSRNYRRAKERSEAATPPEPEFQSFLAGLYTQTLVSLGAVENPATGQRNTDLSQAQYLIDTIGMLKEKTEGNLERQDQQYVLSLLQDLRMRYVRAVEAAGEKAGEGEAEGQENQQ